MYQLYHCKLPQKFYASYSKLTEIHNYKTRNTKLLTYFIPCIYKNFSKDLLSYRGSISGLPKLFETRPTFITKKACAPLADTKKTQALSF